MVSGRQFFSYFSRVDRATSLAYLDAFDRWIAYFTTKEGIRKSIYSHAPKEQTNSVVIFFPDVHGPFHINNSLLIDWFALQGYLVAAVDYFEGDPIHFAREREGFVMEQWLDKKLPRAREITPGWIDSVKATFGNEKTQYVTVGYCFGAPFVMDICATGAVKAGAFAHPAFLTEDHFRNLKQPLLLSCSETDFTFPSESRHKSEVILAEIKATYFYQIFSGTQHGFALRGDMAVENERWAKEESARGIVGWWNRFTKT